MTFTISAEDPRSIEAIEIAAGAGQWLKCHTSDGRKAFGVPSQCNHSRALDHDTLSWDNWPWGSRRWRKLAPEGEAERA